MKTPHQQSKQPLDVIDAFQQYILSTTNAGHVDYASFNTESARSLIMDELAELLDFDDFSRMDAARISALFYFLLLTPDSDESDD
jgi:hypothetical protein